MNIPALPKHKTNTEKFFTYIILNYNTGLSLLQWKNQPNLQRNIRLYEEQAAVFWEPKNKQQLC